MNGTGGLQFHTEILDALPFPLFVVDEDVTIVAYNRAASSMLGDKPVLAFMSKGGEALHCIHSKESFGGCGASEACKTCVVRSSAGESCRNEVVVRRPQRMQMVGPEGVRDVYLLITTSPFHGPDRTLAVLLFQDLGELLSTQGIVPVCMHCRKVRQTSQEWAPMERYLKEHLDLDVSHGLCPDCLRKYYPEISGTGPG